MKYEFIYEASRPGLFGLWRRSEGDSLERALKNEADYLRNWSLGSDLLILLGCLPIVMSARCPEWFFKKENGSAS